MTEAKQSEGMALKGIKVLDFAWAVAGPQIGRMLADYGATVVRIESSTRPDSARLQGPFPQGKFDPNKSLLFETCNANKLGINLNMATDKGRAVARDLAAWSDVVIESFRPGQMAKFGLDYEQLKQTNPSLIMVSSSLLGQTGPNAQFAGYGNLGAALAGFQGLAGQPNALPIGPLGAYTDFVAPRIALIALLAALDHARRTGQGCYIDASQTEAAIGFLSPQIADYSVSGRVAEAQGNRDPDIAPCGVFPCRGEDIWLAITARNDSEWRSMAELIGGTELANDSRFKDLGNRKTNEDALEHIICNFTKSQDAEQLEKKLQLMGIPAHQMSTPAQVLADSQLRARNQFVSLPHPMMGESIIDASRCTLSATPATYHRPAPILGQDNTEVLSQLLGYDPERIKLLEAEGILA